MFSGFRPWLSGAWIRNKPIIMGLLMRVCMVMCMHIHITIHHSHTREEPPKTRAALMLT